MNRRLRILHLEDEPDFAELVATMLAQDSVNADILRVGDRKGFQEAVVKEKFDLILSDFHLPSFTGLEAKSYFSLSIFALVPPTLALEIESLPTTVTVPGSR